MNEKLSPRVKITIYEKPEIERKISGFVFITKIHKKDEISGEKPMAYRVFNTSYVKVSKNPKKLVFSVIFFVKKS